MVIIAYYALRWFRDKEELKFLLASAGGTLGYFAYKLIIGLQTANVGYFHFILAGILKLSLPLMVILLTIGIANSERWYVKGSVVGLGIFLIFTVFGIL